MVRLKGMISRDKDNPSIVYSGKILLCGAYHPHPPESTMLRRIIEFYLLQLGQYMRDGGGMTYKNIFSYMESSLGVILCRDSLQRRMRYRMGPIFYMCRMLPDLLRICEI